MNSSIKELEDITRLLDFAEEGLSQVNNRLKDLTNRSEVGAKKFQEILERAKLLQADFMGLEEQVQIISSSRSRFHI